MDLDRSAPGWRNIAPENGGRLPPLDWRELCARLTAAHELRRALGSTPARRRPAGSASFAAWAVPFLGRARPLHAVNLEPSANSKTPRGMAEPTGERRSPDIADRGLR